MTNIKGGSFYSFVNSLVIMWSQDTVDAYDDSRIRQVTLLSTGKPGITPGKDWIFEIRDHDTDEFRGSAQGLQDQSRIVCEIFFFDLTSANTDGVFDLVPNPDLWDDEKPVTLRLSKNIDFDSVLRLVSAPFAHMSPGAILSEPVDVPISSNAEHDAAVRDADEDTVLVYRMKQETHARELRVSPFQRVTAETRKVTSHDGDDANDHGAPASIALMVKSMPTEARSLRYEDEFDGNYLRRNREYTWLISLQLDGKDVDVTGYPQEAVDIAGPIAQALLDTNIAHFHLRRWLAGKHAGFGIRSKETAYDEGTAEETTIYSLFSRVKEFAAVLQQWIEDFISLAKNDGKWADGHPLPQDCRDSFNRKISLLYKLAADNEEWLDEQGVSLIDFLTDLALRDFSTTSLHDTVLGGSENTHKMATAIVLEVMTKMYPNVEIAFNTLSNTPDLFDILVLFQLEGGGVPVRVRSRHDDTNLTKSNTVAFTNAGEALVDEWEVSVAGASRLAPLFELAFKTVDRKRNSLLVKRKIRKFKPALPKTAYTPKTSVLPNEIDLFPYLRRDITNQLENRTSITPGQNLRLFTDARVQGFGGGLTQTGFPTNFKAVDAALDPSLPLANERLPNASTDARAPGIYSDTSIFEFLAASDNRRVVQKRGGLLWSEFTYGNGSYAFGIIGSERNDIHAIERYVQRFAVKSDKFINYFTGDRLKATNGLLPQRGFSVLPVPVRSARKELTAFFKNPTGDHFQAILDKLRTQQKELPALISGIAAYARIVDSDLAILDQVRSGPLAALFQDSDWIVLTDRDFPKILKVRIGSERDPLETDWIGGVKRLFVALAKVHAIAKAIHELEPISHRDANITAPLLPGLRGDAFDLEAIKVLLNRARQMQSEDPPRYPRLPADLDSTIVLLEALWTAALQQANVITDADKDGRSKAFSEMLHGALGNLKTELETQNAYEFWQLFLKEVGILP